MTCPWTDEECGKKRREGVWREVWVDSISFHSRFSRSHSWTAVGRVRGVAIWRCAFDALLILVTVCLHCFLSLPKKNAMASIRYCVWFDNTLGNDAVGALKQPFKMYITFSIGFMRYILTDGKWFGSFAHLCLFSLHKVHISLSQVKAEGHAKDCSYTWFIRLTVHYLWCVPGHWSFSFVHWKDVKNACYKTGLRRQCKPLWKWVKMGTFPMLHCCIMFNGD